MPTVTHYDGIQLASIGIAVGFQYGNEGAFSTSPELRQRVNLPPLRESNTWNSRQISFYATPLGTDLTTFRQNVYRYLNPFGGDRELRIIHDDGSTVLVADADIQEIAKGQDNLFRGMFLLADPIWRKTVEDSDSISPSVVTGEFKALPTISLTPSMSTVRRRRITITDNTARGLFNYPILIDFDSTGVGAAAAANYIAYFNGRVVPINVDAPNTAATKIWVRIDVGAGGTVVIDLYYGSDISNSMAGTGATSPYHHGGLDLAVSSNTSWTWQVSTVAGKGIGTYAISEMPNACGVWRPGKTGLTQDNTSFGIQSEAGNQLVLFVNDTTSGANDADCMICVLGVEAASQITGLTRSLQSFAQLGGIIESFVKYRRAGANNWTTISLKTWDSTVNTPPQTESPVSTAVTVTDAIEIAIGIHPKEAQPVGVLTLSGAFTIDLKDTSIPTVVVGAAGTARLINGTFTNADSGDVIRFDKVLIDNGTLVIDCLRKLITTTSGPWYGSITFSDPDDWWALVVGENDWFWTTTPAYAGATNLSWKDRYVI